MAIDFVSFIQFTSKIVETWTALNNWLFTLQPMLLLAIGFAIAQVLKLSTINGLLAVGIRTVYLALGILGITVLSILLWWILSGTTEIPNFLEMNNAKA